MASAREAAAYRQIALVALAELAADRRRLAARERAVVALRAELGRYTALAVETTT